MHVVTRFGVRKAHAPFSGDAVLLTADLCFIQHGAREVGAGSAIHNPGQTPELNDIAAHDAKTTIIHRGKSCGFIRYYLCS